MKKNGEIYDLIIDWGDNSQLTYIKSIEELFAKKIHNYKIAGEYIVLIYGIFPGFNNSLYTLKHRTNPFENLLEILDWRKL